MAEKKDTANDDTPKEIIIICDSRSETGLVLKILEHSHPVKIVKRKP